MSAILVVVLVATVAGPMAQSQTPAPAQGRNGVLEEAPASVPATADVLAEPAAPATPADKGRYLATAGNCANCHTAPDGKPFAGGLPFKTPFGTIYSTNITPDGESGLGKWSEQDFIKAMRQGVRPDGQHLYPAFPYTAFTLLSDEDIGLLYAYLKTLEPVSAPAIPNAMPFPFNQRSLMAVWKTLFFKEGRYTADASKPADWNRGAYLVEGLGHCGECHSPRNFLGATNKDLALTGGSYTDKVKTGDLRPWSAVNLTSSSTGLGAWSADDIAAYLKEGHNPRAVSYGPMNEVVGNSTSKLTTDDTKAMAAYLKSLPAKEQSAGSTPSKDEIANGELVYTVRCGTCHLPTGLGSTITAPALVGSAIVQAPDPSSLINTIIHGPQLIEPVPVLSWKDPMKALGDDMTDEDIAKVTTYIRGSWGNKGGVVSVKDVEKQR